MKIRFNALLSLPILLFAAMAQAAVEVKISYPREGSKIAPVKNSFVFGSVTPASATLTLNGSTVPVYRTGSFLAVIPFAPGEFKIQAEASLGEEMAQDTRTVFVSSPDAPLPAEPVKILTESIEPSLPVVYRAGDVIGIRFKGSPESIGEFRFKNPKDGAAKSDWKPMNEKGSSGIYEGFTRLVPEVNNCVVEVQLKKVSGKTARASSPNAIKVVSGTYMTAETKSDESILRTGPSIGSELMGYDLFLPKGIPLEVTGKFGTEVRLRISDRIEGWTEEKNVMLSDPKTLPRVIVEWVRIQEKPRSTLISVDTRRGIPFRATLSDDLRSLRLTLYQAMSNIDRIRHDQPDAKRGLGAFRWRQVSPDTVELELPMKNKIWGYDVRYSSANPSVLTCEIFDGPEIKSDRTPLKDVVVAIDPGHSPEVTDGAIGPKGVKESEVNFLTAMKAKEQLEKAGATVYITKNSSENITLPERGRRAYENGANVFVSIHANALADGQDPNERRGFSMFYYQPNSLELARAMHESYKKNLGLPDDGFYYGNLAVCRTTQMPAILAESAYIIRPDEEELLLSPDFQAKVGKSIEEGLSNFLRKWNSK